MNVKRALAIVLSLAVLFVFAAEGMAQMTKMVPKVDNFIIFVDHSGSMAQSYNQMGEKKIILAKNTVAKMNAGIPELGYTSGFYTFAPFVAYSQPAPYSKAAIDQANNSLDTSYDIYKRMTPMGNGLIDLDAVLSGMSGKTAVIIVTDGNNNKGADPVAQAQAMYAKYSGKICFHVVSFADTDNGRMVVEEIRALNSCSVPADGMALMDDATMAQFIKDVFFDEVAEPAVRETETIVFRSLNFDFDSYAIKDEMIPALEQAQFILQEQADLDVIVEGWTDWIGTDEYNMGLSQNRANAVKNWLVEHGVDEARIESVGKGESMKYDNTTAEGRKLNRRVEIRVK